MGKKRRKQKGNTGGKRGNPANTAILCAAPLYQPASHSYTYTVYSHLTAASYICFVLQARKLTFYRSCSVIMLKGMLTKTIHIVCLAF